MNLRRLTIVSLCLGTAACGDSASFEYDSQSIGLWRAPVSLGSAATGATLAKVVAGADMPFLLVDTGYPLSALHQGACPAATPEPGTYRGDIALVGKAEQGSPVRAHFRGITLFDICPGPVDEAGPQPFGVLGGDVLSHFSIAFSLAKAGGPASMTIFDSLPAGDDDLAADGYSVIRFSLRGGGSTSTGSQASRSSLPASRVVLRACGQPVAFSPEGEMQTCGEGEVEVKSSGANLLLMLSTGHGPLVLSANAWQRLSGQTATTEAGEPMLYSPLVSAPIPAHWVTVSRLALVDGDSGEDAWPGACAELARARRIEWTMAHLDQPGACFQPCDASGSKALPAAAYLEIGSDLQAAVVSDTSDLIRGLNQDFPSAAQVDGIIGAGTLAGTSFEIDYVSQPARLAMSCLSGADRQTCWAPARCVGLGNGNKPHDCFGLRDRGYAPVCPK